MKLCVNEIVCVNECALVVCVCARLASDLLVRLLHALVLDVGANLRVDGRRQGEVEDAVARPAVPLVLLDPVAEGLGFREFRTIGE